MISVAHIVLFIKSLQFSICLIIKMHQYCFQQSNYLPANLNGFPNSCSDLSFAPSASGLNTALCIPTS